MSDEIEFARRKLEAAGMRPSEADLERMEGYLRRRQATHPAPALSSEPWSLPNTERWPHV